MFFLRADGNQEIGIGHIMRCLSIAYAVRKSGEECCFIMADNSFVSVVKNAGFKIFFLDTDLDNISVELKAFRFLLEKERPLGVIVDSYRVTEEYLQEIRKYSLIIYIDDLAAFAYPVDILVNYNVYGSEIDYAEIYRKEDREIPKLLLGPSYAPLRKEFQNREKILQPKKVKNILISTGGADSEHIAVKFAQYLSMHVNYQKYKYHFLIGSLNQDITELINIAENYPEFIELHQNVRQIEKLMKSCDVAISAAGSTLYELCACGIPTITYVLADNQILGAITFEKKHLMLYEGDIRKKGRFFDKILSDLTRLCDDYNKRNEMSKNMRILVDGNGAERIVSEILKLI